MPEEAVEEEKPEVAEAESSDSDTATPEESETHWNNYGLPVLTQELKVGTKTRPSARNKRAIAEKARIKKEADEIIDESSGDEEKPEADAEGEE